MPRARKTWAAKMQAKPPHQVVLDKDFAGIPKGVRLHISSPMEVEDALKAIPLGTTLSIQAFRHRLAEIHRCDAACPVSTSIFLRTVAEHTWEVFQQQGSTAGLAPFWRVLDADSPMAKKLTFDPAWISLQPELAAR